MKILLVNCVYAKGSTGKIVNDLKMHLTSLGDDILIAYGRGKRIKSNGIIKTSSELESKIHSFLSRLTGIPYGFSFLSTLKLKKIIGRFKPDIVNLHCINGNFVNIYQLLSFLKQKGINTVVTNHAEFMFTGTCAYSLDCNKYQSGCGNCPRYRLESKSLFTDNTHLSWEKMYYAFYGFKHLEIVNVSPWLQNQAMNSPILSPFHHNTILNGINTNVFKYMGNIEKIKDKKIVLHVTAHFSFSDNDIKGGKHLIEVANKLKNKNYIFYIAAMFYDSTLCLPENIIMLGQIKNQTELARLYSMANVTVLTSKRETFSMICAESLCCGTPVIGFKAGAPETISNKKYSEFIDFGDDDCLAELIEKWSTKKMDKQEISDECCLLYSKERMGNEYKELFKRMYDSRN